MSVRGLIYMIFLCGVLGIGVARGQSCKIGQVITNKNDGTKGVVFWINRDRTGGWMVAMKDTIECEWGSYTHEPLFEEKVGRDTSGYQNTAQFLSFCEAEKFYAVKQVDFAHGWYVPALGQLRQLLTVKEIINPVLLAHGGEILVETIYFSSTLAKKGFVYVLDFKDYWGLMAGGITKDNLRAVRSFSVSEIEADTLYNYHWNTGETVAQIKVSPPLSATYSVTVTSKEGCGMELSRRVFVASADENVIYDTIRRGEVYNKHGFSATEPGEYRRTQTGAGGCAAELVLHLAVLEPIPLTEFTEWTCEGVPYSGHNFTEWDEGVYTQTWTTGDGRDSVVVLHLKVHPASDSLITDSMCDGEVYRKHGFESSEGGVYRSRHTSFSGCDSVVTLSLALHPVYSATFAERICPGKSYLFHGREFTAPGEYEVRFQTVQGCDSVFHLNLSEFAVRDTLLRASICAGEVYRENGFDESTAGDYSMKHTSSSGCDSVVTLSLALHPVYSATFAERICPGKSYLFHGREFTAPGEYEVRFQTEQGCDSVFHLNLSEFAVRDTLLRASICAGEVYQENGFDESAAGDYSMKHTSSLGCDSVVTLSLALHPVYSATFAERICPGKNYSFHGREFTAPGEYEVRFQTEQGCDSVFHLNLSEFAVRDTLLRASICAGEVYRENGFDESAAGDYSMKHTSSLGCDSVVTLSLALHPVYSATFAERICPGKSYSFHGREFTAPGEYEVRFQTEQGCDSVFHLNLSEFAVRDTLLRASICAGETYRENGFNESEAGDYEIIHTAVSGCDSVVRLELQVVSGLRGEISWLLEDCETHTYLFFMEPELSVEDESYQYLWDFGNGEISRERKAHHTYADSGSYRVALRVTTDGVCPEALEEVVVVPHYPRELEIHCDCTWISVRNSRVRLWVTDFSEMEYEWELGDGNVAQGNEIEHEYKIGDESQYEIVLTVTNADACVLRRELKLRVEKPFIIPNSFSPNGDGVNDVFMAGYSVEIVDRNGATVYKGTSGWDGTWKQGEAPMGTYFYLIRYEAEEKIETKKGYITLIR